MPSPPRNRIFDVLWPNGLPSRTSVFAILDAARDERIYGAVDGSFQQKCCLYSGDLPWQLQLVAPYLIELDPDDWFTKQAIRNGWGNAWGVFLRSETGMKNLRRHLRSILRVVDERGRRLIFRYYDPRVLRAYLPTCRPDELRTVFGPIDCFLLEGQDPSVVLEYSFDGKGLIQKQADLSLMAAAAVE